MNQSSHLVVKSGNGALSRVSVFHRVLAKVVDLVLVFALAAILPYPLGPVAGFLYSLLADGLKLGKTSGQSVGKKLFGLKVVQIVSENVNDAGSGSFAEHESVIKSRIPATFKASCLRNAPIGVATFFGIIPIWGWIILGIIGIPLMVIEVYLMMTVASGHRLGDVMGDTEVVAVY
ncbi:hypothetical protein WDW37_00365 [Bdellovibrionota bacterium FG-1]